MYDTFRSAVQWSVVSTIKTYTLESFSERVDVGNTVRSKRVRSYAPAAQGFPRIFDNHYRGEDNGGLEGLSPPSGEFSHPNTTNLAPPNFRDMNINVSIKQAKVSNLAPPPDLQMLDRAFSFRGGGLCPLTPTGGCAPWTSIGGSTSRPQYRLALLRSR